MKNTFALIIKLIVTFAAAWISFSIFDNINLLTVAMIGVAGTILNYVLGDLYILARFGNTIATLMDGVLAATTAYLIIIFTTDAFISTTALLVFAIMVAVIEMFFHRYLLKAKIVERKTSDSTMYNNKKFNYNTETANELYPYISNKDIKKSYKTNCNNNFDDNGDYRMNINASINNNDIDTI